MRTLSYLVATTLDGHIARPSGEVDFFPLERDYLDSLVTEYPETLPSHARGDLGIADAPNKRFDTVLMGRATYQVGRSRGETQRLAGVQLG